MPLEKLKLLLAKLGQSWDGIGLDTRRAIVTKHKVIFSLAEI
jgi:hypothetical protein